MTLVNLDGFQRGIASDEVAINCREFKCTVEPEFKVKLGDIVNEARGFAVAVMQLAVEMAGEISGDTGILAATTDTAFAPVNPTDWFGAPATGLYLDRGEVTAGREQWLDMSASLSSNAGIA